MTPPITNHARTAAQREAGRRRSKKYYTLRQIQRDNARHVAGLVAWCKAKGLPGYEKGQMKWLP